MHARIDDLLSLRDAEPVDAAIAEHVARCAVCAAQLSRLRELRVEMQALPQLSAPEASWEGIRARLVQREAEKAQRRVVQFAGLGAAAALVIIAVIAMRDAPDLQEPFAQAGEATTEHVAELQVTELVQRSQQLEQVLERLPERPRVERVSTAATLDSIEERIQWLDVQLSYAPEDGMSEAQARRLWQERVDLMDSLVKVRYAEAGRTSF